MRPIHLLLSLGLCLAGARAATARDGGLAVLTPAQAREDVRLAIDAAEAALPEISWRMAPGEWARARITALAGAETARDPMQVYALIAPLMSTIGEGHLTVRPSPSATDYQRRTASVLPLDLHWSTEGLFIVAGHGEASDLEPGSRLLSVNGEGPDALLAELASLVGRDGRILTGPMRDGGGKRYAVLRNRRRGEEPTFNLRWSTPRGEIRTRTVAAFPLSRWPASPPAEDASLATLEWLAPGLAYLNVPSFSNRAYRDAGLTFRGEMQRLFEDIQRGRATRLILDLRENGGGSEPNESILFSYLVAEPLQRYAAVEASGETVSVTSASGRTFQRRVFDEDEINFQRRLSGGHLTRMNVPPEVLMTHWAASNPVFSGRLVVLAGGATFSGGAELASMLHHARRGVFVGEETAGAHEGNTSGYVSEIELPNSGVRLHLPLLQFRAAWPGLPRNRGVPPDCDVPPRATEIGVRRDRAWRVARAVAQQEWTNPDDVLCPAADPGDNSPASGL